VIQAYLYRSEGDVQDLLAYGCRIRLCKGAYKESLKWRRKEGGRRFELRAPGETAAAERFLSWIATHDPKMIGRRSGARQKKDFERRF